MPLPMTPLGGIDDLLERARKGAVAGNAMAAVQDVLTQRRDSKYREMLNAPDDKVLNLRNELKAIEVLAQDLLKQEIQGELAHQALMDLRGDTKPDPVTPLRPERVSRKRVSRARRQPAK